MAREAIEKAFKQAGVELSKEYEYAENGVKVKADGYDPQKKIGYIFAGYDDLGSDAFISWSNPPATKENFDRELRYRDEWFWYQQQMLSKSDWRDGMPPEETKQLLEKASPEVRKRWEEMRLSYLRDGIHRYTDVLKKEKMHSELVEQANAIYHMPLDDVMKLAETMRDAVFEIQNDDELTLGEIKDLEKLATEKKTYIAVISQFDRRFLLPGIGYQGDGGELKKTLQELEDTVSGYIAWARAQGVQ